MENLKPSPNKIFLVSKDGKEIYRNGKLKPQYETKTGYMFVCASINGKQKNFFVHRLVAEAWIENPNNLPQVNHKDFDKHNNHVDNLEWCSHQDNISHYARSSKAAKDRRKICEAKINGTYTPNASNSYRDFKAEHTRRNKAKKRMPFEVDKEEYDKLTPEQKIILNEKVRQVISNFLKRPR